VVAPGSQARARAGVAKSLQRCGISEELAHELIDAAGAHALALAPRAGLVQAVRATLAQRIPVAPPLATKGAAVVVVGAGGAGKTTFCTTLLGAYRRSSSLPASFATIAREGERGELQMLLAPHIVKPTPAAAPNALRALRRARGEGMAILDTPSLSPSDRGGARELARLLAELTPERVVVALPATLGATAAAQLLQALAPLGANTLAITHADETDQLGVAVEAACRFGLAPEYMLERGRGGAWRLRQLTPGALAERLLP
jgi:flagellar biosynthesis GTPase FlhF